MIRISTDRAEVDPDWLRAALAERSYRALGRSREIVERSVPNSLCFSALCGALLVGRTVRPRGR